MTATPSTIHPAPLARLASRLVLAIGAVTGLALLLVGDSFQSYDIAVFSLVLSAIHVAPWIVAWAFVRDSRRPRVAITAAGLAAIGQFALMASAYAALDDDAQGGLVFVFVTPIGSAALAVMAALAARMPVPGRRR